MFVTLFIRTRQSVVKEHIEQYMLDHYSIQGNPYPNIVDLLKEAYNLTQKAWKENDVCYRTCQVWNSAPIGFAEFDFHSKQIIYYSTATQEVAKEVFPNMAIEQSNIEGYRTLIIIPM